MSGDSHPARKVDQDELKELLKDWNEDVPALTTRALADEYPTAGSQAVSSNLHQLVENGELNVFYDGDRHVWWYPRPGEEAGAIKKSELLDNSIDWEDVEVHQVPQEFAKQILEERFPNYHEQTFWNEAIHASQLGLMVAFGLVILGIGGVAGGSFGIGQEMGGQFFFWGLRLSLLALVGYVAFLVLNILSAEGYVAKSPRDYLNDSD